MNVVATPAKEEPLYEVVNGQRVDLPPPSAYASWLVSRLSVRLGVLAQARRLGIVVGHGLFIFDQEKDQRRRPDIAFVSAERWPLDRPLPEEGDWAIVPDLAVEVTSPNDNLHAVFGKVREYFRYEVRQVWMVVPTERQVHVYDAPRRVRIVGEGETLDNTIVPGFALPLAELFQRTGP